MPLFMLLILTADNIDVLPAFPPNTLFLTSTSVPRGKALRSMRKLTLHPSHSFLTELRTYYRIINPVLILPT
jgi:hypothetical protein